jgi:hypothetical protein
VDRSVRWCPFDVELDSRQRVAESQPHSYASCWVPACALLHHVLVLKNERLLHFSHLVAVWLVTEPEGRVRDELQTVAIGARHWYSHSCSGIADQVRTVEGPVEGVDILGSDSQWHYTTHKAAGQTCEVLRESPCTAETRS